MLPGGPGGPGGPGYRVTGLAAPNPKYNTCRGVIIRQWLIKLMFGTEFFLGGAFAIAHRCVNSS
jgi:hypothetical protein